MLRSLLIGFLILSALTSNGAGAQNMKSANITMDMLLELFSTVAVTGTRDLSPCPTLCDANKASDFLPAKKEASFFGCGSLDTSETDTLFGSWAALWPEHYDYSCNCLAQKVFIMYGQPINSGAPYCVSGLSPPSFRV